MLCACAAISYIAAVAGCNSYWNVTCNQLQGQLGIIRDKMIKSGKKT